MKVVLEKTRNKVEKNELKIFNFLSKICSACKTWSKNFSPFWSWKYVFLGTYLLKNWIKTLYFHLLLNFVYVNSRKNYVGMDVFSVNQPENNDKSGNKESATVNI